MTEQEQQDAITQLARIDRARTKVIERWLERTDDAVATDRAMAQLDNLHAATCFWLARMQRAPQEAHYCDAADYVAGY